MAFKAKTCPLNIVGNHISGGCKNIKVQEGSGRDVKVFWQEKVICTIGRIKWNVRDDGGEKRQSNKESEEDGRHLFVGLNKNY